MTGKGPTGQLAPLAIPTVLPTATEKCPKSPGKRRYYNLIEAETAAAHSAKQYGKPMTAYVCDGCGLYHVTGKTTYGDVTKSRADGTIVTAGMSTRKAWKTKDALASSSVERADMSQIIAMEKPIIGANPDARAKLLKEWLGDRDSVTLPEVMIHLQCSRALANQALHAVGWRGRKGTAGWIPPGAEFPPASPKSIAAKERKQAGKSKPGIRAQKHAAAKKALRAFLKGRERVSILEAKEVAGAGIDQVRKYLREMKWEFHPGDDPHWAPVGATVTSSVTAEETVVEPTAPIDLASRRHPAAAAPVAAPAPVEELGWRDVVVGDQISNMTVGQMLQTLSPFGFEVRVQIRPTS